MAKSTTSFSSNNQPTDRPPRGETFKTKLIAALERRGLTEASFIDLLLDKAVVEGGVFMTELLKRYNPPPKSTLACITFDFQKEWTPLQKADAIMNGMSSGDIPPDVGVMIIEGINKLLSIEETTELSQRLEALEKIINAKEA